MKIIHIYKSKCHSILFFTIKDYNQMQTFWGYSIVLSATAQLSTPPKLWVKTQGQGDSAVLCLHGFSGSHTNWRRLSQAIEQTHQVIRFDAKGHGKSQNFIRAEDFYLETILDDIKNLIDEHAPQGKAILCGLSMGAVLSLCVADKYPDSVKGLILSGYPCPNEFSQSIQGNAIDFANAIDLHGLEAAGERFVWGKDQLFTPEDRKMIRLGFLEHSPIGLSHTLRYAMATFPTGDALIQKIEKIQVPTLLIAGSQDQGAINISQTMFDRIKSPKQLVIIPDGGHLVNLDSAMAYNEAVIRFLKTHQL